MRTVLGVLSVLAVVAASCGSGTESDSAPSTVPLSEFPPETCVTSGWAQDPALGILADAPETPIESLPDDQQIQAMNVVIGCFDATELAASFDGVTTPFDMPPSSAECLAQNMVDRQDGAAFLGFNAYTQGSPPAVTEVDLRPATVGVLAACVPPNALAYGLVLRPFLESEQNEAVDRPCVDRSYLEQTDPSELWGASFDQRVLGQSTEASNRIVYEPGLRCVSFGLAYAASVKADTGVDLSATTVGCMDQVLGQKNAVDELILTGSNQDLITDAANECMTPEERQTFGQDG